MEGVTPKLVLDNRVNVSENYDEAVRYSGVNVNQFQILPDGSGNYTTQILFNNIVVPNLATTLVSRNFRLQYKLNVSYTQGAANAPHFAGVIDNGSGAVSLGASSYPADTVLRAPFALQSVCDTVQIILNGGTSTINARQVLDPLARRFSKKYLMGQASEAPSMLDNRYQLVTDAGAYGGTVALAIPNENDWAAVVAAGPITATAGGLLFTYVPSGAAAPAVGTLLPIQVAGGGSAIAVVSTAYTGGAANPNFGTITYYTGGDGQISNQPLSAYENCWGGSSRASFLPSAVSVVGGVVTVSFDVTEQIYVSPLTLWDNETFLANVNTLSLLLSWGSLKDILYSANPNMATTSVTIPEARLDLQYIQTNPAVMKIPQSVNYNYENIVYFSKSQSALAGNAGFKSAQMQSDTIRFQALPSMIYVIVREPVASRGDTLKNQTQTFYSVGGDDPTTSAQISVSLGNRTGLMASASAQTWYREAKRLGFQGSWNEWNNGQCVLMIDPTSTLGIDPSLDSLVGETGSVNFQISGVFNNRALLNCGITGNSPALEMLIVVVYSGVAKISTDQCMFNIGPLSANEINATLTQAQPFSSEHIAPTIQGQGLASPGKLILGKMAHK
jgi:hypothetical protein